MAFELWTHQFCLSCDKQTEGEAYCSESCRLADFEKTSTPSSEARSPSFSTTTYQWTTQRQPVKFYLSPAYDFSKPQPYNSTYTTGRPRPQSTSLAPTGHAHALSPSSSHSSLCSMQSTVSSNADESNVSEKARRELRAYAISFEQVRLQRRRSY